MYCRNCGKELSDNSQYCAYCGNAVDHIAIETNENNSDSLISGKFVKPSFMSKIVCELCSSNDIVKKDGFYVCAHCGTKYSVEEAKKLINTVDVRVTEPVKVVNDKYETEMANVRNLISTYFERRPNNIYTDKKNYDAIIEAFNDAEKAGGAKDCEYWEERSDFHVRSNFDRFGSNPLYADKNVFIYEYSRLMDFAIKYATEEDKQRLKDKKAEKIKSINDKYDRKNVHYIDDGTPIFKDAEETSSYGFETAHNDSISTRFSSVIHKVLYKNGRINTRLLIHIGIALSLILLIVVLISCEGSKKDSEIKNQGSVSEGQSPNGDLVLTETEVSVDKDGNTTDQILENLPKSIKEEENDDYDYPMISYKSNYLGKQLNINSSSYTFVNVNNNVESYPGFTRSNNANYYYCSQTKEYFGVDETGKIVAYSAPISYSMTLAKYMGADGITKRGFIEPYVLELENESGYAVWKTIDGNYLMVRINIFPNRDIKDARVIMHFKVVAQKELDKYLCATDTDAIDNESNQAAFLEDVVIGVLPDSVLNEVKGHYEDNYDDTVDISSPDQIVRFVPGNDHHTYNEKVCGYHEIEDGYLILVEWNGYKYTYLYKKESGAEYLYAGAEDGWNPNLNPYIYNEAMIFVKKDDNAESTISEETSNPTDTLNTEVSDKELYSVLAKVFTTLCDYGNYGKTPYFLNDTRDLAIIADNYNRIPENTVEVNGQQYPTLHVEVYGNDVYISYEELVINWDRQTDKVGIEIYAD